MHVEAGEIVDAWLETDEKDMEKILNMNKHKDKYWVVLFHNCMPGKKIKFQGGTPFVRLLRAYDTEPRPLVGAHIGEVDNQKGKITWRTYPKDIPIKWGMNRALQDAQLRLQSCIYECNIPSSYIYNKVEA